MLRQRVKAKERTYLISPDDPIPLGERLWVLVRARVVDELTSQPPPSPITLETNTPRCIPRVTNGGLVGLVGVPRHVLQPRSTPNYTVHLTVQAEGYVPRHVEVLIPDDRRTIAAPAPLQHETVLTLNDAARLHPSEILFIGPPGPTMIAAQIKALGPGANQVTVSAERSTGEPGLPHNYAVGDPVFPVVQANFAPTDRGDLQLHREPTVIRGRTVQANGGVPTPLAGAIIRVTGIWRTPPPANAIVPADPPNFVSLQPPLYAERVVGTGKLHRWDLPVIPDSLATEKRLLTDVAAGASAIRLSNRVHPNPPPKTLNPGDILLIDAENPDRQEHIAIHAIAAASDPALPAALTLDHPLAYPHRRGALVQLVNSHSLGSVKQFVLDPNPGEPDAIVHDTTVFLNNVGGLVNGSQVRITGGTNPNEYHRLSLFSTTSDADGYYRLPPLSRVAQVEIRAEHGGLTPVTQEFRPDYRLRENRLDFIFR